LQRLLATSSAEQALCRCSQRLVLLRSPARSPAPVRDPSNDFEDAFVARPATTVQPPQVPWHVLGVTALHPGVCTLLQLLASLPGNLQPAQPKATVVLCRGSGPPGTHSHRQQRAGKVALLAWYGGEPPALAAARLCVCAERRDTLCQAAV